MIKYPDTSFDAHLKQKQSPIYLIMGQDSYLLEAAVSSLKNAWRNASSSEIEAKRIALEQLNDWKTLIQEACSYQLFYENFIIDANWNKKNIDAKAMALLAAYAEDPNFNCLMILRAPLLTPKQCNAFNQYKTVTLVSVQSLTINDQIQWIKKALDEHKLTYTPDILKQIQAYTHGNLHAAHQTIERLALTHEPKTQLTLEMVQQQLLDERQYKIYEISAACLNGEPAKALDLVKRAQQDQMEPTLILWFISQELRLLEQLASGLSYQALKIHSFRIKQYQQASKRLPKNKLYPLIQQCQLLDIHIKSGALKQTWIMIEQLILKFTMV